MSMTFDGMNIDGSINLPGVHGAAHGNPMFDYLTSFAPRKLKDLLKWAEYLGVQSPHIYAIARKFGEYPITRLVYESNSQEEKDRHEDGLERKLGLKGFAGLVSFDLMLYGNSFVSVYEPFQRMLICPHCQTPENITAATYHYNLDRDEFRHDCRECQRGQVKSVVHEEKVLDIARVRLIRWDPKAIDIEHNPVTGESVYYYQIPRDLISKVRGGNKLFINHMPRGLLRAMQAKKTFKFDERALFHIKLPSAAGLQSQWGYPPLVNTIKSFLFAATLRRANEAIALEHIVPRRIVHPLAASGQGDPITTINMGIWKQEFERATRLYRTDPLHIQTSPIPVGITNIGGEGRALLTLGEVQEAEKNIVLGFGVPMEFLTGGLGQVRGEITLRQIENQLQTHIEKLNALIQWIERRVAAFMGWSSIRVHLADFKMIDDVENKQIKLQLWQAQLVSDSTIASMLDIDLAHERKQRHEDSLKSAKQQTETQIAIQRDQQSLSTQAQQGALQSQGGLRYDQQAVIAQADMLVQQLAQLPEGTRTSRLDALKGEDFVMYAVTVQRLQQAQQDQDAAAKAQTSGAAA
jgi:hypothetical protein